MKPGVSMVPVNKAKGQSNTVLHLEKTYFLAFILASRELMMATVVDQTNLATLHLNYIQVLHKN